MLRSAWHRALLAALLAHAVLFQVFVFSMQGVARDYETDLFFWGSILREQDLLPVSFSQEGGAEAVQIMAPSAILPPVQMRAWRTGSAVDKPYPLPPKGEEKELPGRFMTERVELDPVMEGAADSLSLDIPDPPRVKLLRPGS